MLNNNELIVLYRRQSILMIDNVKDINKLKRIYTFIKYIDTKKSGNNNVVGV